MSRALDVVVFAVLVGALFVYAFWFRLYGFVATRYKKKVTRPDGKEVFVPKIPLRLFMYYVQLFCLVIVTVSILYISFAVFVYEITATSVVVIALAILCLVLFSIAPLTRFRDPVYRTQDTQERRVTKKDLQAMEELLRDVGREN